jgi:hypothetical protein
VLFTSYAQMRRVYEAVEPRLVHPRRGRAARSFPPAEPFPSAANRRQPDGAYGFESGWGSVERLGMGGPRGKDARVPIGMESPKRQTGMARGISAPLQSGRHQPDQ